ncbi:bacterial regulatory helix-turn-helix, lysR family protein, partial [Vibrio parahaemolyticus AQ3810]
SLGFLSFIEG